MRVTTDLWVSALVRRAFASGGFAAVVRRGSSEAGAVMLVTRDRLGTIRLYAPAAQSSYEEGRPEDRRFTLVLDSVQDDDVARRVEKEVRFDPDLWVVELEVLEAGLESFVDLTMP